MGFLKKLFGGSGLSAAEAEQMRSHFEHCQRRAKEFVDWPACRRNPPNRGDWLLEHERDDPAVAANLKRLRADGVTDDDIRWWWNQQPLEAGYMIAEDQLQLTASFLAYRSQGMSAEDAAAKTKRLNACYSDVDRGEGEDRFLPIELRERVIKYLERQRLTGDMDAYRAKLMAATSFNAQIRAEIRNGNL